MKKEKPENTKAPIFIRRKLYSWRTRLVTILGAFLLSMVILLGVTFRHFYRQTKDSYEAENEQVAQQMASLLDSRLSAVGYQLHQLMIAVYDDQQGAPGRVDISWQQRNEYMDAMDEALVANKDGSCFYIFDRRSGQLLLSAASNTPSHAVLSIKDYIRGGGLSKITTITNPRWYIVTIDDDFYFMRNITLGRYTIGAMSELAKYDFSVLTEPFERDFALVTKDEESILPIYSTFALKTEWTGEEWENRKTSTHILYDVPQNIVEGTTVLAVERIGIRDFITSSGLLLFLFAFIALVLFYSMLRMVNRMIYRPTASMVAALEKYGEGQMDYQITDEPGSIEFDSLFDAFNTMTQQIQTLRIEAYDRQIEEQQQELTMLRQQLVPHFYLNAITTLSNMTYQNDGEQMRNYLSTLARYMRYMMSLKERTVPLGAELEHIRNYLDLQQARFPDSVYAYIGCPESLKDFEIPYLLVFTLVENTIKHAMDLYSTLQVLIQCEWIRSNDFEGCRITVEDNGPGFDQETLQKYSNLEELPKAKEHIGLTNVLRTMQLTYHRSDLVKISNGINDGAHIELYVPVMKTKEEEDTK